MLGAVHMPRVTAPPTDARPGAALAPRDDGGLRPVLLLLAGLSLGSLAVGRTGRLRGAQISRSAPGHTNDAGPL